MKKTGLLALGLALAIGVVAEAGSIPTDRVPLKTYAIKKVNCYLQPNGTQKGWIDPGDYVEVTQIRSDGWAYGSYPVGNGRVSRWFRADDLVNNIGFANQERYSPKANTYTYTNPNHNKQFGSFNDNEPILVVSDSGQSRQFIYKLNSGGYKMAWVPYWDCWDARQAGKQQVNNNTINTNPIVKPVQREEKKQEQSSSYGVWKATARYRANTYDNPNLSGARAGWVTAGSDLEVLGENAKSYYIRYWTDNGTPRARYVERTAVKGLNEDKDNKKQVNNNTINTTPIVKPVQREEKKQEQSSSYGVWKATARYRANTYDNPNLSGARAGWVTAGSDLEVLGENAKSYYIRYWTDNGTPRARYVERTAVKGLNEDKDNKKQVNNNTINTTPINIVNGLYSIQPQCAPNSELTVLGASKTHGTDVIIYSKNSQNHTQKSHQKWYVTRLSNGYYKITAENSGLALNNHNGANINGNPITQWEYSGFCQEFRFFNAGNGYYYIQPKGVSGVLDVSGGGSADNTKVQLYQYNGTAAQKWKLERRSSGKDDPGSSYKEWSSLPKRDCDVFEYENLTFKKGRVDTADPVIVFSESGNAYHIRYKLTKGGTKEGWVTKDIFKDNNANQNDVLNKLMYTIYSRDGARLLCDFDGYTGTYKKKGYRHEGIDVSLYDGAPVYATISGYVLQAGGDKLNTFSIKDNTNNRIVVYLHMKNVMSSYKNKYIKKGTLIGYQGSQGTGSSHVHIEVTNGKYGKAEISMDSVLKNQNPYSYWKKVLF